MSSSFNRPLKFEIRLPAEHPQLLQGLDELLRLNLISDAQVRQICREYLVCQLVVQPQIAQTQTEVILQPSNPAQKPKVAATPGLFATMWRSLRAELSVRWLLFLGMFTVVISSGALAASQWERFTAFLQYSVLFAYTLGFWGLGLWTGKQANLRLTSGALHIVTMLLIPINFWAMDSFGLWQNPINLILVGIAAIVLSGITVLLSKHSIFTRSVAANKLSLINILGLSYLHWGWKFTGFPLIAVYLAVIVTTLITVFQENRVEREEGEQKSSLSQLSWGKNVPAAAIVYASMLVLLRAIFAYSVEIENLGLAIGIYGWLIAWLALQEGKITSSTFSLPSQAIGCVLLFLGWYVTIESNPLQAIAISGLGLWFFHSRLHLYSLKRDLTAIFVIGLQSMWLGWRLLPTDFQSSIITTATQFTNSQNHPWALLSVGLFPYIIFMVAFTDNLRRTEKLSEQGVSKLSEQDVFNSEQGVSNSEQGVSNSEQDARTTKPSEQGVFNGSEQDVFNGSEQDARTTKPSKQGVFNSEQNVFNSSEQGAIATNKLDLAGFGEQLTLILGVALTAVALQNPILRSLNLLLSAIALAIVTYQHFNRISSSPPSPHLPISPSPSPLTYLTHVTAILTLFSWINLFFPISQQVWAVVCLVVMVAEWLFSIGGGVWQGSAWHIGLALAGLSYLLLATDANALWNGIYIKQSWGLSWLATPVTLSVIGSRSRGGVNKQKISVLAIAAAQLLTLPLPGIRLIGLASGAAVMFVNTRYLRNNFSAVITVGFCLSFILAAVWEGASLSYAGWFVLTAVIILGLWVIRILKGRNELTSIYAVATDFWASTLCGCELLLLSLHAFLVYSFGESDILLSAISAAIILVALSFRHWQQPNSWTFYGIGWAVELLVVEILGIGARQFIYVAIANIGLGLITQLFGEWWQSKHQLTRLDNRWHILPLLYAGFGVLLRWNTFDSWTGLSTLGVALIVIGVGKRDRKLKPLLYLGLIGVSIAAYELLVYQLMQMSGGAVGDGWIAFATLATAIMYAYRLLSRWLTSYLRLSNQELKIFAHFHWALGSVLLIAAINYPIEAHTLALATELFLACYAIFQGRQTDLSLQPIRGKITEAEIWVYIGLAQAVCLRYFLPDISTVRFFLEQIRPWQAAVSCIIAYSLYILPWERWGWSKKPWQIAAYVIPLISLWETTIEVYSISLLFVAGYYIFIAKITRQFRFTYISLALVNWALWRGFIDLDLTDALWYICSIGLSLLYIAQFDSQLKLPQNKLIRHGLRILGSGMICGYATVFHQDTVLIPGIFSSIAIFAGLALRIRAFLYVGTATFLIAAFYHLVIFILRYPFLKWVVGLFVGIALIFIAANFESRRQQFTSLLRNTNDEFKEWE